MLMDKENNHAIRNTTTVTSSKQSRVDLRTNEIQPASTLGSDLLRRKRGRPRKIASNAVTSDTSGSVCTPIVCKRGRKTDDQNPGSRQFNVHDETLNVTVNRARDKSISFFQRVTETNTPLSVVETTVLEEDNSNMSDCIHQTSIANKETRKKRGRPKKEVLPFALLPQDVSKSVAKPGRPSKMQMSHVHPEFNILQELDVTSGSGFGDVSIKSKSTYLSSSPLADITNCKYVQTPSTSSFITKLQTPAITEAIKIVPALKCSTNGYAPQSSGNSSNSGYPDTFILKKRGRPRKNSGEYQAANVTLKNHGRPREISTDYEVVNCSISQNLEYRSKLDVQTPNTAHSISKLQTPSISEGINTGPALTRSTYLSGPKASGNSEIPAHPDTSLSGHGNYLGKAKNSERNNRNSSDQMEEYDLVTRDLGVSFEAAKPISYYSREHDFENYDSMPHTNPIEDSDFDDDFHYLFRPESDIEPDYESDFHNPEVHENFDVLRNKTTSFDDYDDIPFENPMDETDGDDFSSDGDHDFVFSDDSDNNSQSDSESDYNTPFNDANPLENHNVRLPSLSANIPHQTHNVGFNIGRRHLPICPEYHSLGGPTAKCNHCYAQMWDRERVNKGNRNKPPIFSMCCGRGQIKLPRVKPTPKFLQDLYNDVKKGPTFRNCIRSYNAMLNFTSIGGKIDHSVNKGRGPKVFRMSGVNHHKMGSLLPINGDAPKFCQLYIYDTVNEVENRLKSINAQQNDKVDPEILEGLLKMLEENNHLVKKFRMARDRFKNENVVDLKIVMKVSRSTSGRENHLMPSDEIAVIMVGDEDPKCEDRDIVVSSKTDGLKRISTLHPLMMSLQYPVLFPHGEDGFHKHLKYTVVEGERKKKRENVTMKEYYSHTFMVRLEEGQTLRLGGRLYHQFIVDAFSAVEQSRLWYIRKNQKKLRSELYRNLTDVLYSTDNVNAANVGQGFILPSSFVGSARYMQQNFQDSLAVCRKIGYPDLFLTMTCNPYWDEILQMMSLLPACNPQDCPDIIARVFKLKLEQLYDDIKNKNRFGKCISVMYVVEYQKRGLPHAHMLIWLDPTAKDKLNKNIDSFVSAEIPDESVDPNGYAAVKQYMIHGPCGVGFTNSPCMKDNKCTKGFPKQYSSTTMFDEFGFPIYKRRKTSNTVDVRKAVLDNRWVVPYNRDLIVQYQCHINIEVCNHGRCIKYLFKYCLKGPDRATVLVQGFDRTPNEQQNARNEIKMYLDGRYVCGAEAAHRIFGFDIHHRSISVERLSFHLPGEKYVTFKDDDDIANVCRRAGSKNSKLEAFFELCRVNPNTRQYTYQDIPQYFVWDSIQCQWNLRKKGQRFGRLNSSHYSSGELWYLRMLLCRVRGPKCFRDLRTFEGRTYDTFHETCLAMGLLNDDNEWHEALRENIDSAMPYQLRSLFVHIIVNCQVSDILKLWTVHWRSMSDDILSKRKQLMGKENITLTDDDLQNYTLAEIEHELNSIGRSLKNFPAIPMPPAKYLDKCSNKLVLEETSYCEKSMSEEHQRLVQNLNSEQKSVFDSVLSSVENNDGKFFFVYGSGGCGKTYLWNTIITKLRSEKKIVLPVASSGIAATLLPGGRTAHSRFKIPLKLDEESSCSIPHNSDIAELIKKTSLIIWDEAPMQNKLAFECLDRTLRDIMKSVSADRYDKLFGGITVLLGGDFRQILPVIRKGSRADIVAASICRSHLWSYCHLFILKHNMRLRRGKSDLHRRQIEEFSKWVLDVGDGKIPHLDDSCADDIFKTIPIPTENCVQSEISDVTRLIDSVYPDLHNRFTQVDYLRERAILTPTNKVVDHVNNLILDKIEGETFTYLSADSVQCTDGCHNNLISAFPVEYLNSFKLPGMPAHKLILKEGVVVMLLRNLNQTVGLCNGTRMIIKKCFKHTIVCEIIGGNHAGATHLIPRIEICPSDTGLPFNLVRLQFPLQVCFAMTINKAQGQSLDRVGLYLPEPVFCHGQLYVGVSRVTSPEGLTFFIEKPEGGTCSSTSNIVYEEIFYDL